ncbi:MAG TPA: amidohydrolase family protein [Pseudolabrys sp.]|nr:amidohydrolase family protein [Pseudolabrys sp.]
MHNNDTAGIDRRLFLAAAGAAATLGAASTQTQAQTASPPASASAAGEYVIRNAYVVTMDRAAGDVARGDIHIRNGAIVAIGPSIAAQGVESIDAAGMIAMPGMIDTHWHLWNTTLRNMQRAGKEYFPVKAAFVEHFTPQDHYRANRLALAEAVNAGITTVTNFSHNVRSPAHADAELRAMQESGIRGRYCYGPADPTPKDKTCDLADIKRVKEQWFGQSNRFGGRVDLGMAMRGLRNVTEEAAAAEYRFAKEQGIPTIVHTGASKRIFQSVAKLVDKGYVDKTTILSHWIGQTDADLEAVVKSGASVSFSPTSDLRTPYDTSFHDAMFALRQKNVNLSMSLDSAMLGGVSMFEQMATTWYVGVPWYDTPTEKQPFFEFTDVLEMATVNGARALGIADKVGTLAPGKRADIVLVRSSDLNMAPLGEVHSALARVATVANVDTVIIDGRVLKRGGKLVGIDAAAVVREAEESSNDLRRKAGGVWAPR